LQYKRAAAVLLAVVGGPTG